LNHHAADARAGAANTSASTLQEQILIAVCSAVKALARSAPTVDRTKRVGLAGRRSPCAVLHFGTAAHAIQATIDQDLLYVLVGFMAGGRQAHVTNIVNKQFSKVEIEVCHLLGQSIAGSYPDRTSGFRFLGVHVVDEREPSPDIVERVYQIDCGRGKGYLRTAISSLGMRGGKKPMTQEGNAIDPVRGQRNGPIQLKDADLAAWLHEELPQVGALILSLVTKEQAYRVLGLVDGNLALDVSRRLLVLDESCASFAEAVVIASFEKERLSIAN
jgi:hypothetical protein